MKSRALAAMGFSISLVAGCSFQASIDPQKYFPCMPDGSCPSGCKCLAGQACVPEEAGQLPELCQWCPVGKVNCDSEAGNGCEADLSLDPRNCGACGAGCEISEYCQAGACIGECTLPYQICGRLCLNLDTNHEHCGDCNRACSPEQVCSSGECKDACPGGTVSCAGACVDTKSDPANCGGCGNLCVIPNGVGRCLEGECRKESCFDPYRDCNGNVSDGCEADLSSDGMNCNGCGNDCGDHGLCVAAACGCETGWANCNDSPDDGCETDTTSSFYHCGRCDLICPDPYLVCDPEGDIEKIFFMCIESTCHEKKEYVAPCESNCGQEGECVCVDGVCVGGPCGPVICRAGEFCADSSNGICGCGNPAFYDICDPGARCCSGICTPVDNTNCEGCGIACPQHSSCLSEGEGNGRCDCNSGHGDCYNGMASDGCETMLKADPNCGECELDCSPENYCLFDTHTGSAACEACPSEFMDCNDQASDGCETNIFSDPGNCGGCGDFCGMGDCCGGICTELINSAENCGMCGNACVGNKPCTSGRCGSYGVFCISEDGTTNTNCEPGLSCCLDLGSNIASCEANGDVVCMQRDWQIQCDDSVDCPAGMICCISEGGTIDTQATKCAENCEALQTVCASNGDCSSEYVCCSVTLSVGQASISLGICRETCN